MENITKQINRGNLQCPLCNNEIGNQRNIIEQLNEFNDLNCEKCNKFIFILCQFCRKKIFYKKNSNNLPLNGMNGINIQCPYPSCRKYFFLTICPKCKQNQKIPKIIKEGDLIKCNNVQNRCQYEYIQVRCPRKHCNDITYFARPKNFCNSPNGILYNHKKKLIFQKITCHFCIRPIVYYSDENKINRYYDSMKIICPYQDCKKIFNRIICPICSEINIIENGYYIMGNKIKCNKCCNYFGKILCPKCKKINPLSKHFFKSGAIMCSYTACAKKSEIVNCIHCRRINVFEEAPIHGQQIICGYTDCGKAFNEVYCPSCNELNPFPKGNFLFGTAYKCLYSFCQKTYQFFVCSNCHAYSRTTEAQEGKKYICNKCKIILSNWGCPFCHKTIMDKNSTLNLGQMIRCPSCQKQYSFSRCYECKKLIFSKENQNILGLSITCESCKNFSVNIICPKCNSKISILERMNNMEEGEIIHCEMCKSDFEYKDKSSDKENEIYYQNLSFLNNVQGESINFGESSVDDSYISIENLFIKSDLYIKNDLYINSDKNKEIINNNEIKKKKNNLCILCHCNTKESIFYPCGHRCTCYKCAVLYFTINQKCPKCDEDSEAIVPRIYEQFNDIEKKII